MSAPKNLEQKGIFAKHPFAELLVEIVQAKFSGSLRVSHKDKKTVIYLAGGQVVYAVSNSKALRLFNLLLRKNRIDTKTIAKHPNFANDIEFAAALVASDVMTKEEIDAAIVGQIEEIVIDVLSWTEGEWHFNALARARDDVRYAVDIHRVLIDYARLASTDMVFQKFKSVQESFTALAGPGENGLQMNESFVLSQFNGKPMTIGEIRGTSAMPEAILLQALYVLWLGGWLKRSDWNAAFSPARVNEILSASVSRVSKASNVAVEGEEKPAAAETDTQPPEPEKPKLPTVEISLDDYLERAEKSETHYDILGLASNAPITDIKQAYFSLAKQFHPDRYHREQGDVPRRVQTAFTQLAQAYETLKTPEGREGYDYKMRKEIEAREKRRAAGQPDITDPMDRAAEQGLESFEQGLNMLNDEEYAAAAAFLARACHYNPQNALYHAYYGKALSADEKQRHKAESEMQTAVRLDPKNAKVRMMLVEFFMDWNMTKRAEGELKRFLEIAPDNKDAQVLLAKVQA